jgi:hypothetical protein
MKEFHKKELKKLKQDLKIYMQDCMLGEILFFKRSVETGYIESADG